MIVIDDILQGLSIPHTQVRHDLLQAAREQREAVIEALLPVLTHWVTCAEQPETSWSEDESRLPDYAMFLLAEFREPRAFDCFVRLCHLGEEATEHWLGDLVTEGLPSLLASTCCGRHETLYALFADERTYTWSRSAAASALLLLVVNRELAMEDLVSWLHTCASSQRRAADNSFWNHLAVLQCDLRSQALMPILRDAYRDELVDEFNVKLPEIESELAAQPVASVEDITLTYDLVRDAGVDIAWIIEPHTWSSDMDAQADNGHDGAWYESSMPFVRDAPKVGRNDPCPCGSGRKYKKCCL